MTFFNHMRHIRLDSPSQRLREGTCCEVLLQSCFAGTSSLNVHTRRSVRIVGFGICIENSDCEGWVFELKRNKKGTNKVIKATTQLLERLKNWLRKQ